jgi:hypothetical protein
MVAQPIGNHAEKAAVRATTRWARRKIPGCAKLLIGDKAGGEADIAAAKRLENP